MPNYFCYSNITLTLMYHFCKFDRTLHHRLCVRERVKHRTYKIKRGKNELIPPAALQEDLFLDIGDL